MTAFYKVVIKDEDGSMRDSITEEQRGGLDEVLKRYQGSNVVSADLLLEGDHANLVDEIYDHFLQAGQFAEMAICMSDRTDVKDMSPQEHEKLANDLIAIATFVKEKMERSLKLLSFLQCSSAKEKI